MTFTIQNQTNPPKKLSPLNQLDGFETSFVDHSDFHRPDACDFFFEQSPAIPDPPTFTWVNPAESRLSSSAQAKPSVLTFEQERLLFLQFNYARFRVCSLRNLGERQPLDASQYRTLLHWQDVARKLRDKLVRFNLRLVPTMAGKLRSHPSDFDELVCEGNAILLKVIDRFDVKHGFRFSTYACRSILRAMYRLNGKLVAGRKQHKSWSAAFDELIETANDRGFDMDEQRAAIRRVLTQNTAGLTPRERQIVLLRYPLRKQGVVQPTLARVASIVGLSKERVRQIEVESLQKIRQAIDLQITRSRFN